mmetsp:Transcript_9613/g.22742  ORF Transcript_9613/g.22742 Transcript_9613/m.22742 type:complete len:1168 (+) Transcript_9613:336-3839(+)
MGSQNCKGAHGAAESSVNPQDNREDFKALEEKVRKLSAENDCLQKENDRFKKRTSGLEEEVGKLIKKNSDILMVRSEKDLHAAQANANDDDSVSKSSVSTNGSEKGGKGGALISVNPPASSPLSPNERLLPHTTSVVPESKQTAAFVAEQRALAVGSYPPLGGIVASPTLSEDTIVSSNPHHPNYNRRLSAANLTITAPLALAREHIANLNMGAEEIAPADVPARTATPVSLTTTPLASDTDARSVAPSVVLGAEGGGGAPDPQTPQVQPAMRLPTHDQWEAPVALATLPLLPCVIISDPGEDLDDEIAMIMLRFLVEKGHLQCKGVIANLKPSEDRARLMRGTLDTLGLYDVPVGMGTDGGSMHHRSTFADTAKSYMPSPTDERAQSIKSGRRLLYEIFHNAEPKSLVMVLISSLKDAALFLRDNQKLFVDKIRYVTIMGGVEPFDENDTTSYLEPDTAQNNQFDRTASHFFYRRCQELGVPMIILSRLAAYSCPVTKRMYDYLAQTNSPVGCRLQNAQKASIENLWARVCLPGDDPNRCGLPARCDAAWFSDTFCGGHIPSMEKHETIWDHVTNFKMYDTLALIAAVPSLRETYFDCVPKLVRGVEHLVCGASAERPGLKPGKEEEIRRFMSNGFFTGLTLDMSQAVDTVIISDPGQDQDDEMAMVLLRSLTERGLVNCRGIVTNLCPASDRARLARGTLDVLGLDKIPVAVGTDGGSDKHTDNFSDTASAYMPQTLDEASSQSGSELLLHIYQTAPVTGIRLLLISSIKDAAKFMQEHEEIFVEKTKDVTIMGGVKPFDSDLDDNALLEPDTAQNNTFCMEGAEYLYRRCQELGVPLVILTRHSAYRCPMPRSVYDRMARTGNPIGVRLQKSQRAAIEDLWVRACLPDEDPARLGLPPRCNKEWFCNTFCNKKGKDRGGDQSIWDLIKSFNMYDPMALLASIPQIRHRYFNWKTKVVNGVEHIVIGMDKENNGVHEELAEELVGFMYNSFLKGVTLDWSDFDLVCRAVEDMEDGDTDSHASGTDSLDRMSLTDSRTSVGGTSMMSNRTRTRSGRARTGSADSGMASMDDSGHSGSAEEKFGPDGMIDVSDSNRFRGTSDALKDSLLPEENFVDSNELFMSQFDEQLQSMIKESREEAEMNTQRMIMRSQGSFDRESDPLVGSFS